MYVLAAFSVFPHLCFQIAIHSRSRLALHRVPLLDYVYSPGGDTNLIHKRP